MFDPVNTIQRVREEGGLRPALLAGTRPSSGASALAVSFLALALLLAPLAVPAEPVGGARAASAQQRAAGAEPPLRVYVVSVDSLRPQEVGLLTPTLSELKAGGTWYEQARAVLPAETLPNHAAMMSGVFPERSGIVGNQFDRGGLPKEYMQYPEFWQADTLTTRLERAFDERGGIATATVQSKEYLYGLFRGEFPGAGDPLAQRQADFHWDPRTQPRYVPYPSSHAQDSATMDAFRGWIAGQDGTLPEFAFVNLGDVDRSGHADESGASAAAAGGVSAFRQAALEATDAELGLLVDDLQQSGAWDETVLIVASDHGMDWGPQSQWSKTTEALTAAGYKVNPGGQTNDYTVVGGGGSELIYPHHRADVVPMARILCAADGVAFIAAREPVAGLPAGCDGTTLGAAGIDHPRSPEIEVFLEPGWHSSPTCADCTANPLPGNHGHAVTQRQTLLVSGGHPLLDEPESVDGESVYDPAVRPFAPPARGPGNLSIAPTVAALFGIGSPAGGYDGTPLAEAFDPGAAELHGTESPVTTPAAGAEASEPPGGPGAAPLLTVGVDVTDADLTHATYSLLVTNRGAASAEGVVLTNTVPANTSLSSSDHEPLDPGTCQPGAPAGTQCRWAIGGLAPGASATVEVTYVLGQTDTTFKVVDTASAQLADAEPASGDPIDTDFSLTRASEPLNLDATVDDGRADTSFGACQLLDVRGDGVRTAFLDGNAQDKFDDNATIPPAVERVWDAELRATVASAPLGSPQAQIAVHSVKFHHWEEGTGGCGGADGSGREARAPSAAEPGTEPPSETNPAATAPVSAPGLVAWDVTSALDTRGERVRFNGFELRSRGDSLAGADTVAFHSFEASGAGDRPRLVTVRTQLETTRCIAADPETSSPPSDRAQRVYAYVTDSGAGRFSAGGRDACNGTPVPGAPVGWEFDQDSPDAFLSGLAGEVPPVQLGSHNDAGPNRSSTLTGPSGRTFVDVRLAEPYAGGAGAGEPEIAAIALVEHTGYNEPPFGSSDQGTCEPGEPNVVWGTSTCEGNGESAVEDDVLTSWVPAVPPLLSIGSVVLPEGTSGTSTAEFTITLSAPSELPVEVDYRTADGTAAAPGDYAARGPSTLHFAPGETSEAIVVAVAGDAADEPTETFSVELSNPSNAGLANTTGIATILDDDGLPDLGGRKHDGSAKCRVERNGTAGADSMTGTSADDLLRGLVGADRLLGRAGSDCLFGGPGGDRIKGGRGDDLLRGGDGRDLVNGGGDADVISGGRGPDRLRGGPGNDRIRAVDTDRDWIACGPGDDRLLAGSGDSAARDCERVERQG